MRLLAAQRQPRAVVVLVLNLLGLGDAHAVAAPVVGEEAGEADVVDGVLADHDDLVPVGGGNSPASPFGAGDGVAECSMTNSFSAGTPTFRYEFFAAWYLPCAQATRDA